MSSPRGTYRVFKRSARNWDEFATARKTKVQAGLSYQEAQAFCARANEELTPLQKSKGTKYEFESE